MPGRNITGIGGQPMQPGGPQRSGQSGKLEGPQGTKHTLEPGQAGAAQPRAKGFLTTIWMKIKNGFRSLFSRSATTVKKSAQTAEGITNQATRELNALKEDLRSKIERAGIKGEDKKALREQLGQLSEKIDLLTQNLKDDTTIEKTQLTLKDSMPKLTNDAEKIQAQLRNVPIREKAAITSANQNIKELNNVAKELKRRIDIAGINKEAKVSLKTQLNELSEKIDALASELEGETTLKSVEHTLKELMPELTNDAEALRAKLNAMPATDDAKTKLADTSKMEENVSFLKKDLAEASKLLSDEIKGKLEQRLEKLDISFKEFLAGGVDKDNITEGMRYKISNFEREIKALKHEIGAEAVKVKINNVLTGKVSKSAKGGEMKDVRISGKARNYLEGLMQEDLDPAKLKGEEVILGRGTSQEKVTASVTSIFWRDAVERPSRSVNIEGNPVIQTMKENPSRPVGTSESAKNWGLLKAESLKTFCGNHTLAVSTVLSQTFEGWLSTLLTNTEDFPFIDPEFGPILLATNLGGDYSISYDLAKDADGNISVKAHIKTTRLGTVMIQKPKAPLMLDPEKSSAALTMSLKLDVKTGEWSVPESGHSFRSNLVPLPVEQQPGLS